MVIFHIMILYNHETMSGNGKMKKSVLIMLIIMLFAAIAGGIWYILKPGAVRDFNRRFPEWDRHGKMQKASNLYIRVAGVVIILISALILTGLILILEDF